MIAVRCLAIAVLCLWWLLATLLSWCGFAFKAGRNARLRRRVRQARQGAP